MESNATARGRCDDVHLARKQGSAEADRAGGLGAFSRQRPGFRRSARGGCGVLPRSEEGTRRWAEKKAEEEPQGDNISLAVETLEGELVGSLDAHHCEPRDGSFRYGIALFRPHWRSGYATEAVRLLLRYYFHELRYEKATAHVYAFNEASMRFQEALGFQLEARLREQIFTNGRRHDELIYGMLRHEFDARFGEA